MPFNLNAFVFNVMQDASNLVHDLFSIVADHIANRREYTSLFTMTRRLFISVF